MSSNRSYVKCDGTLPMAYQTFECELDDHHEGPHACLGSMHKTSNQLDLVGERVHLRHTYSITWTSLDVAHFRTAEERFPAAKIEAYVTSLKGNKT